MKKVFLIVLVLSVMAWLPATAGAKDKQVVLGKVPYTLEHAYHQSVAKEFKAYAAKKYKAKAIIVDGEASNEKTLAAVESLISQKVDGIALHTGDAGLMTTAIKLAHKAGIPIVTTFIRPSEKLAPHIQAQEAPSSLAMGKIAAAKWMAANPGKSCKVAMLNFGGFEQIKELRTRPFFKGVKSVDPKAELVTVLNGHGSTVKSMEVTLDILQGHPDVNIIFGGNDEMALGALAACEQLGRGKMDKGKPLTEIIAGIDGNEAALMKIYDPNCSFKLTQGAVRDNARAEVDTLMAMIQGKMPMDKWVEIPVVSKKIDYWNTPIEEAQKFLEENFFFDKDLKALVAKAAKK